VGASVFELLRSKFCPAKCKNVSLLGTFLKANCNLIPIDTGTPPAVPTLTILKELKLKSLKITLVLSALLICSCGRDSSPGQPTVTTNEDRVRGDACDTDKDFLEIHKMIEGPVSKHGYKDTSDALDSLSKEMQDFRDGIKAGNSSSKADRYEKIKEFVRRAYNLSWACAFFPDPESVESRIEAITDCPAEVARLDEIKKITSYYKNKDPKFKSLVRDGKKDWNKEGFSSATDDKSITAQVLYFFEFERSAKAGDEDKFQAKFKKVNSEIDALGDLDAHP
jgi:hypothetical protein